MLTEAGKNIAPFFGSLFLIPAIASIFMRKKKQKLLAQQKSIDTLKALSWQEFEMLVGEAFRRKGFAVIENMTGGADGGIDLLLKRDDKTHIVQCKHWRSKKIGVSIVREMFGIKEATNAKSVFIVASGTFTKDAIAFARGLPIELIGGHDLLNLIADVQSNRNESAASSNEVTHHCPKCSSKLVKRIAKQGAHKGNEFLGCSSFPKCRYIES